MTNSNNTIQYVYAKNGTAIPEDLCTVSICSLDYAQVEYLPTLAGNLIYLIIFAALFIAQCFLGIRHKTWGFFVGMFCGIVLEVLGYAGRVMLHGDPFDFNSFLLYLIPLTIGPAFLSAAIYLCLGRIIMAYGSDSSRFQPKTYMFIFCGCDFFSLLLQSVGGAIAATANDKAGSDMGANIMVAGLAFQVFSLLVFIGLAGDYALRVHRAPKSNCQKFSGLRASRYFKWFKWSLAVATFAILIRSIFRVIELQSGFGGSVANNEALFMIFEGPFVIIACFFLTICHPGLVFKNLWAESNWSLRGRRSGKESIDSEEGIVLSSYEQPK
ncbi:RTA1-domain-containing protein [Mytilinidion resinicola]|uniref:RTA1-domain-containing protein n=1 Tax=Mytilinidion resinicola TaxID=574789 RepID=A0A6A6XZH0_9PEZI|nr:RTA1-domain-containing protein [Mytilinidion resinicola]KAF2801961.1 RTA1-domain-containing protein [Mytilinidion resinicola]